MFDVIWKASLLGHYHDCLELHALLDLYAYPDFSHLSALEVPELPFVFEAWLHNFIHTHYIPTLSHQDERFLRIGLEWKIIRGYYDVGVSLGVIRIFCRCQSHCYPLPDSLVDFVKVDMYLVCRQALNITRVLCGVDIPQLSMILVVVGIRHGWLTGKSRPATYQGIHRHTKHAWRRFIWARSHHYTV